MNAQSGTHPYRDVSLGQSVRQVKAALDDCNGAEFTHDCITPIRDSLSSLHAKLRTYQAADYLNNRAAGAAAPELMEQLAALRDEHPGLIGRLDRLIRQCDSIADKDDAEQDVFELQIRELLAILNRHEAEANCLFYKAIWSDIGGES